MEISTVETSRTEIERDLAIATIMADFNFDLVYKAMTALNWKWAVPFSETEMEIPGIQRLREQARILLENAWAENDPELVAGSGGFRAGRSEFGLSLEFVLQEAFYNFPDTSAPAEAASMEVRP